ncbi:MAG: hypothetical protein K0M66_07625 [Thiobacillus sp.]|nr:hypothetical protein [Thiobacillus sp.]
MERKTIDECSPDEALAYLKTYLATVDVVSEAQSKCDTMATKAAAATERSKYRALSLEAERDLELLVNQRRAFLNGKSAIRPPDEATVERARDLAERVGKINASSAKINAMLELVREGLEAFNSLSSGE